MPNYQNGKIYKLWSPSKNLIYYGSTTQTISQRLTDHLKGYRAYTKDSNKLYNNKIKLLIQHLIGLKTEVDRFTDEEIEKYDIIYYYDDDQKSIDLGRTSNDILNFLTDNSEESIKPMIKDVVKKHPILILNKSTFNKVNRFIKYEVILNFDRIIKTYESFRLRF